MNLRLEKPALHHEAAWLDIVAEIQAAGEAVTPYSLTLELSHYLDFWRKTQLIAKRESLGDKVRADTYFLLGEEKPGRILGAINLRYELNEYLREFGGHIGYGIRPSERGKGYATAMLGMALEKYREAGFKRVLLTCDTWNTASAKVMEHHGGVLENVVDRGDERIARYWIEL
ncbi:MAG: GNAT family N-acetyltransferase [Candidatus Limiplasma sp.]|nr:GNAT family N-acetyltransferase [Candidatus Limiplasma sp.]